VGKLFKSRVFVFTLILSFGVLIYLSNSGTCLSQAVVLMLIPFVSIGILIHLNCLSARMFHTLKPPPWYVWITCCSDLIIVALISSLIISMVKNVLPFIDVNYIHCKSNILSGRSSITSSITLDSCFIVVLPFRDPRFGPSMSLALKMSTSLSSTRKLEPFLLEVFTVSTSLPTTAIAFLSWAQQVC